MFSGRIGIIQRILADYRRPFFEKLASLPLVDLSVFAGQPLEKEGILTAKHLSKAHLWPAKNLYWPAIGGYICWQRGISQWLHKFDPDVLIIGCDPRLLSSRFAVGWMKRRHRPSIGWGLGELPRSGPKFLKVARHLFARNFIHRFSGLLTYSSKAASDCGKLGVSDDRIFVAHNAIDNSESEKYLSKWGSDDSWKAQWREWLGFDPDLPSLLFVGRLLPQKKVDMLINAYVPLLGQCQLLIVGDGPSKSYLEEYAKPYGEHIRFAGHQSGEMLAKCFIASDIFVLPGWGGLALYQAMSYGKPVIASFGDGTEVDLVQNGVNGVIFKSGDEDDLRDKIYSLLRQQQRLPEMGRISIEIIRKKMSLDAMVDSFYQTLTTLSVMN